jgi:hypothetical protein
MAKPGNTNAPSPARQRTFIVDNADILDRETKLVILRIVMMESGSAPAGADSAPAGAGGPVVLENSTSGEVSINLDAIADDAVVNHIYNIVANRRRALNEPAY